MTRQQYNTIKLDIFEKAHAGEITDEQRDELFTMLEADKAASELTASAVKDFFAQLSEKYPDLADDIEKLQKKIDKSGDSSSSDDADDDDSDDSDEE